VQSTQQTTLRVTPVTLIVSSLSSRAVPTSSTRRTCRVVTGRESRRDHQPCGIWAIGYIYLSQTARPIRRKTIGRIMTRQNHK